MKVLVEIKNGLIVNVFTNHNDVQVQIIDHDTQEETPSFIEHEAENIGLKGLRQYVQDAIGQEENVFDEIYSGIEKITNNGKAK